MRVGITVYSAKQLKVLPRTLAHKILSQYKLMNGAEKKLGHYYYIHLHCHYYQRQKLDSCEYNSVRYIQSIPKVPLLHMEIMKVQLYSVRVLIHACTARVKYHWWTPVALVYWYVHHNFHDKELFVSMCDVELPQQCVPNSFFKFLSWTVQLLGDLLFDESPYIVHCHRTADPAIRVQSTCLWIRWGILSRWLHQEPGRRLAETMHVQAILREGGLLKHAVQFKRAVFIAEY
jgi:hypothetical protein